MSTWRMFSDAGNSFRWEKISKEEAAEPNGRNCTGRAQQPAPECLPSMADLLLQGYSKLIEARQGNSDHSSKFRTGLGKPVSVKQSSVSKALALLGVEREGKEEVVVKDKGFSRFINEVQPSSSISDEVPLFRTGMGTSVGVKQSSIARALAILGDDEGDEVLPRTGQGKGEGNGMGVSDSTTSWFDSGKAFKRSKSVYQAEKEKANCSPNSLFQTASGKMVNISSAGLLRAKSLLGSEEYGLRRNFEDLQQTSYEPIAAKSPLPLQLEEGHDSIFQICPLENKFSSLRHDPEGVVTDFVQTPVKPPTIKFQTAGGRSISVSSDALQRARSLLGDQDAGVFSSQGTAADQMFSAFRDIESGKTPSEKETDPNTPFSYQQKMQGQSLSKNFTSPLKSYSCQQQFPVSRSNISKGNNLIKKFDAEANDSLDGKCKSFSNEENACNKRSHTTIQDHPDNGFTSIRNACERPPRVPLSDISNKTSVERTNMKWNSGEKRRIGRNTVSPFKRPRSSFVTPLSKSNSSILKGSSALSTKETASKGRVSTRYPFQISRLYMKEYLGEPPSCKSKTEKLSHQIRTMNPEVAEKYMFSDDLHSCCTGAESFYHMLIQSGASQQYISKAWVANHYKWIVWKLASYERCYPAKFCGKLLSVSNVLEELKYRYEKEVNHGHRSIVKRILEGDSPPSTRMVLCISSVFLSSALEKVGHQAIASKGAESDAVAKIELTDGWYSVTAILDVLLSRKLVAGKLFVGQKLTIWGAALCGSAGPVSPLEVSQTTSLLLHINGTYRAHWADRLGICKVNGIPLAFRSIKCKGGVIPSTIFGVLRIYPVLYRERLQDGSVIVRSERMQANLSQLYNQRRSVVVEGVMSEFQMENKNLDVEDENGCEEGAKLLKILEKAAEPELLMAEMTPEQLNSFATYKAKLEAERENKMQKSLEKALEAAGLSGREFTPFMRVRVVGLASKTFPKKCIRQIGLITIWNPTEKQQLELVEGRAYVASWLTPLTSDPNTLHLQTKGSSTKWIPLSPSATECFQPFFNPRRSIMLSHLGEVSLSSEFDIAAYVVYVGDVYTSSRQKKQWVFVADGSPHELHTMEPLESLLAISFCIPSSESDLFAPVNSNLAGSTVGFCNLIKRAKDHLNNVWVAEATESSTYTLNFDQTYFSHLKDAASLAQNWATNSNLKIGSLKRRVLSIISNSNA
ncbi:OLC1v1033610C1 [Oldenlandia corymbosa var. corymbosa]|uniref:OLC1v1033610C1 n=1 Tax=Oldenlandia corymbosa var. corymbosa TaxID=529605 RepID=A0AAV1CNI5_OLDCO|nr:OLC1v1033610C1 [Oldenlandia corymbosa var. corymbosa]